MIVTSDRRVRSVIVGWSETVVGGVKYMLSLKVYGRRQWPLGHIVPTILETRGSSG